MTCRWCCPALFLVAVGIPSGATIAFRPKSDAEIIREGLAVWRKPDFMNRTCASCHSPDGIELAAYNFDTGTVLRRASAHLPLNEGYVIDDMIQALRRKYGFKRLLDPMKDRPMQPGGAVLPGNTPLDRDFAFARNLNRFVPTLMGPPIDSLAAANRARTQIAALDCRKVPIGIQMNRLSEDEYRGSEHATLADWFPDVMPKASLNKRAELTKLEDEYLAEPTQTRLWAIDASLVDSSKGQASAADQVSLSKFRALLFFQHRLRTGQTPQLDPAWARQPLPNPMWNIGDFGRLYARAGLAMLGYPEDVQRKKSGGPSATDQMHQIRLGWFWSGWLLDPALEHSGAARTTRRGDYFTTFLWDDGPYPVHNAFAITKKLIAAAGEGRPFELDYSVFLARIKAGEPMNSTHRALFRKFACNSFRMSLLLLQEQLERTHAVRFRDATLQQARMIGDYLAYADEDSKVWSDRLVASVTELIQAAKEIGTG